jgi:hypothetical protein
MKRIENFLDDYSIVIKLLLALAWVLWGLQLSGPIKEGFKQMGRGFREAQSRKIDWEAENRAKTEIIKLADGLVAKAESEGNSYGPKRYFEDLRMLYEREAKSIHVFSVGSLVFQTAGRLQQVSNRNINKGLYSWKDAAKESDIFVKWRKEQLAVIGERDQFDAQIRNITLRDLLFWLVVLYFRTLPLVAIYYLVKMTQRRGILETVLAGKSNFFIAILLWPIFYGRYPFNVIREIRVEAELRRIKGLFRIMGAKELKTIRQIANGSNYEQWLTSYHKQNQPMFKRGLILALGGTIAFHILLLPSISRASEATGNSIPVICKAEQGQGQGNIGSVSQDNCQPQDQGLVWEPDFMEPFALAISPVIREEIYSCRETEPIDQIPLSLLLGWFVWTITQTVLKGWNHERENDHSVGCLVCRQFSFCR